MGLNSQTNLPPAFCARMAGVLQQEYSDFIKALEDKPVVSVRLNPFKPSDTFKEEEKVPWSDHGKYLKERPVFTLDPLLHAGAYYVQEASSMFLEEAVKQTINLDNPVKVLDLCAAPGGKSTLVASLIFPDSLLVANEVIKSRVSVLEENLVKWGAPNVFITNNDPEEFKNLPGFFDLIITDAPCSGEGLFRKDAGAGEEWSEENVSHCAARQRRILENITAALKPGGILIYSTCTFSEAENEENVRWLVHKMELQSVRLNIHNKGITETKNNGIFAYRFYPHKVKGEGFFISCLRKKEGEEEVRRKNKRLPAPVPKNLQDVVVPWLEEPEKFNYFLINDEARAVLKEHAEDYALLSQHLKIRSTGINMGKIIGNDLIPSHQLALSVEINKKLPFIELGRKEALDYLRKNELRLKPEMPSGWTLARYKDHNLGWIKVLKNRINNYYPKEWRIRMRE